MFNPPTPKQLQKIPSLYSQENVKDKKIYMKFFIGADTWYIAEINHKPTPTGYSPFTLMFAYHVNERTKEGEWGYVSLEELKRIRVKGFIQVDRDLYEVTPYSPKRLSKILKGGY